MLLGSAHDDGHCRDIRRIGHGLLVKDTTEGRWAGGAVCWASATFGIYPPERVHLLRHVRARAAEDWGGHLADEIS